MSILKPLAGADDELDANLASFGALDYPDYEILLGVASQTDGALPAARRFLAAHPDRAQIVITDPDAAVNPKVAQLIALERRATGEVVVVSDSNVRVGPDYLWSLWRELEPEGVGLVTSLFVGTGEQSIGAALENLQLGAGTAPGILATNLATPWPVTIGKSMAMRRRDLAQLGGFGRFGGLLAEDQAMGDAFAHAGFAVRTSLEAVHNRNTACTMKKTAERHTRWAKIRRSLHPVGYVFEPLLSPLTVAAMVAVLSPSQATLAVAGIVAVLQTMVALGMVALLRGRAMAWKYAPLEVVRTFLAFGYWVLGWISMRIQWRGHPFLLLRGSAIVPAPPSILATVWARLRAAARA
ncbi:MAG TPA: glycosyltransferase [Polyangiaceae bacterium]|jgi:ceramide glucosyltransferase